MNVLLLDDGEDICSPVWINVVMLGGVAVNETRNASWFKKLSKLNWQWFFGDNVSENKRFELDKHYGLKSASFKPIN